MSGVRKSPPDLKPSPSVNQKRLSQVEKQRLQDKFFVAVQTRNVPEIYRCLEKGARPSFVNREVGVSPLHMLAERNDADLGLHVLQHSTPDLNVKSFAGYTPLHLTCLFNCRSFLLLLLNNGVDINLRDILGRTPLHIAVLRQYDKLVVTLLKAGASPNVWDVFQESPLSVAITRVEDLHIAETLLRYGVDMTLESQRILHIFFETVLHCHTMEQIHFVALLLDNGVDVNLVDERTGRNCLHFVAMTGFLELAIFLVTNGARADVVDQTNRTPEKVAQSHGNRHVYEYLHEGSRRPNPLVQLLSVLRFLRKAKERVAERKAEQKVKGRQLSRSKEGGVGQER